jgi:predicted alpha/beta superfamily hydrolase
VVLAIALGFAAADRILAQDGVATAWARPVSTLAGDLRVHDFTSRVFGNTRKLRVLLPDGYDRPENAARRYPVLYLNDGQNLFDTATAMFNPAEWQVDEAVRALAAGGRIQPLIVVGVDNAGRRGRPREYLPYVDEFLQPPVPDPQGRHYPAFLADEVMPFVNARYRTRTDIDGTGVGGSSYGALAALYTVVARPGVFGQLLVESPSIYVDDARILQEAASARWPARVYLGVGTNEGGRSDCRADDTSEPEAVADVKRLERLIRQMTSDSPAELFVVVEPCATHHETAWARRLPRALEFLFGSRAGEERRRSPLPPRMR